MLSIIADPMTQLIEWVKGDGQTGCWAGRIDEQKGSRSGSEMSFSAGSLAIGNWHGN